MDHDKVKLILDWSPNTNHSSIFLALKRGYFNFDLHIKNPFDDHFQYSAVERLTLNQVHLALGPSELALHQGIELVAAMNQHDNSAILTTEEIKRPRDLQGLIYGSFGGFYEEKIVQELIKKDGGHQPLKIHRTAKNQVYNDFFSGKTNAVWIFLSWEGLNLANQKGYRYFSLNNYNIPFGYTPALLAKKEWSLQNNHIIQNFKNGCQKAVTELIEKPKLALEALDGLVNGYSDQFIIESQKRVNMAQLNDKGEWGVIDHQRWQSFKKFLKSSN